MVDVSEKESAVCVEQSVVELERPFLSTSQAEAQVVPLDEATHEDNLSVGECRICQQEDTLANLAEPCACDGSLKYAHRECIQAWCNSRQDNLELRCELCKQPYKEEGWHVPRPSSSASSDTNDTREDAMTVTERHHLAILALQRHRESLLLSEEAAREGIDEHESHIQMWWRAALVAMLLLMLMPRLILVPSYDMDIPSIILLSTLRMLGYLLPLYVLARAIWALRVQRELEQAAAMDAAGLMWFANAENQPLGDEQRGGVTSGSEDEARPGRTRGASLV